MNVVPAPLETILQTFEIQIKRLSVYYPRFQIDIADGVFVPNTTIQISDIFHLHTLAKPETVYDFHLMVKEPVAHIEMIKKLQGITLGCVFIHKSVFPDHSLITSHYPLFKFGLVLNPKDEVGEITDELIRSLPAIQVMTVNPGFQGSPFIEDSLTKIEQLRKRGYRGEILIDGSVNEKTIPTILSKLYKPDILGVGSYLTRAPAEELERRVGYLKRAIHNF